MKYKELTHKIIGCAMKVHSTLGNGFQEVIYQRALAIEMGKQGLRFSREHEMTIFYEGIDIGTRRVDFFVEDQIMVELKALIRLEDIHLAQAMNYCEAYYLPIGLLLNFGGKSLEFKRVYNLKHPDNKDYKKEILKSSNPINPSPHNQSYNPANPKNPGSDNHRKYRFPRN
ncbi:MAG: GxxExxY protein [Bacteroidales bacterium]|nr:GxxExxY protein [Bacteroidales bacterium]MBN2764087.1 GxxExxY protein [Bacteroidales bacterium]